MLSGLEPTLATNRPLSERKELFLLSADLSKATDHISSELACTTLIHLLEELKAPEWMIAAVPAITKNIRLFEKVSIPTKEGEKSQRVSLGITECGALMGLGPSWTVLSLLNAYAAFKAAIQPQEFAVCGDDLIALANKARADEYERRLRSVCLVPNREKSFRGPRGVFCEKLFFLLPDHSLAKCTSVARLAECTGTHLPQRHEIANGAAR
jgi:hypothetical protein